MARIAGIDLPPKKRGVIALTYIFGIGRTSATKILDHLKIDHNKKVQDWNDEELTGVRKFISENIKTEGALRADVQTNIKRLMDIGSYRGLRHRKGLPVRGQKTQKNARTRKGKRKTVPGKKKVTK